MKYTGHDLINLGFTPGPYFKDMLDEANVSGVLDVDALSRHLPPPPLPLVDGRPLTVYMDDDEHGNKAKVIETMKEVLRTPPVTEGFLMPDACPTGPVGTIPVGGVVLSTEIHPGMHSADMSCSVAMSVVHNKTPAQVLDAIHEATHFGTGPNSRVYRMPSDLLGDIIGNRYTAPFAHLAIRDIGSQGDGNHFAYVGTLESTGQTALVTHHGSRSFGAQVYKRAMREAVKHTAQVSPDTLKCNSWVPDPEVYHEACQLVGAWTWYNHRVLHDAVGAAPFKVSTRHNTVWIGTEGRYIHLKGAVLCTGRDLIPLNMAEPVLIVEGFGFAPHGAGRNFSRSEHERRGLGDLARETEGLDVRWYYGVPDLSELPSAYKSAEEITQQIEHYNLGTVVDRVLPYGCIMAGRQRR